ncbi:carbon-nitrogen hydrolase [Campylobacter sputorum]|uniref:carbon-nitrogen hydrolase n=1 Tax=Campylobacter sputorum TaxID=206 RepID=UPI001E28BA94|nr:carbon-nitrogen hydrolase [Campylobacter sputorum]
MSKILKVGIISHEYRGSKTATIEKTVSLIEQAVKNGANLVVLQELHQGAYFCQSENVDFFDLANDYESDVAFWSNVAREYKIVLVTSLFEKRSAGIYHNSAVVFDSDGKIAGKYRKMHIPDDPNFYEKFYFTPGDLGYNAIQTSVGKLGVLVCWDQWYPEAARLMCLSGAEILIYPTAIGWFDNDTDDEKKRQLDAWIAVQRGHAIANGVPVVTVNRVGFESDGKDGGIRFWGNSFAFGPQGEELFSSNSTDELSSVVEIDMIRSENVRRWWPFLRDRRIDSYFNITKRFVD